MGPTPEPLYKVNTKKEESRGAQNNISSISPRPSVARWALATREEERYVPISPWTLWLKPPWTCPYLHCRSQGPTQGAGQGSRRWAEECAELAPRRPGSKPRRCGAGTQALGGPLSDSPTASKWRARRARRGAQTRLTTLLITTSAARRFPTTQPLPSLSSHLSNSCTPEYNSICSRTGLCPLALSLPWTVLSAGRRTNAETNPCYSTSSRAGGGGICPDLSNQSGNAPAADPAHQRRGVPPTSIRALSNKGALHWSDGIMLNQWEASLLQPRLRVLSWQRPVLKPM